MGGAFFYMRCWKELKKNSPLLSAVRKIHVMKSVERPQTCLKCYNESHAIRNLAKSTNTKDRFGTWTIGGKSTPNMTCDEQSLSALRSALELGYTHFDTAEAYAAGHAEELLSKAIREQKIAREALFITSKVSPEHLNYEDVLSSCGNSLRRLGMDYLDLYLVHWPMAGMNLEETFLALNKLVQREKCVTWEVSNFKLKLIKQAVVLSEYSVADELGPL